MFKSSCLNLFILLKIISSLNLFLNISQGEKIHNDHKDINPIPYELINNHRGAEVSKNDYYYLNLKKKDTIICAVDYASVFIYLSISSQPEKQIMFIIQALVEITVLFDDAVVPWDAKKLEDFLNVMHEEINGLHSCVSTACVCVCIIPLTSSQRN